jgi:phospholipid transport system substrate-binding protein
MLTRRTVLLSAAFVLGLALPLAAGPGAGAVTSADAFVRDMGKEAIDSLTSKTLTDHQREARFRTIFERSFDIPVIARATLGQYWRIATPEQRKEYVTLFEDFVVQAYAARFKDYSGESFKVGQTRVLNDREKLVGSEIIRPNDQPPVKVQWRLRGNSDYKVVDVIVEGISMLITHRDEFAAVIQQNGGKVDGLLADLRKKTAEMRNSDAGR